MLLKCRWHDIGGGSWHTTVDSDVAGVYIQLDPVHKDFAVMRSHPFPKENERVSGHPDLKSAKAAAKAYYIEHLHAATK